MVSRETLRRSASALAIDRVSLAALILCATAFVGWSLALKGSIAPTGLAYLALMPLGIFYAGRAVLRLVRAGDDLSGDFCVAFLTGAIVSALVLTTTRLLLPIDIRVASAILFGASLLAQRPAASQPASRPGGSWVVLAVAVALGAASLWSQDLYDPVEVEKDAVVFKPWTDYFIHANVVARFTARRSLLSLGHYEQSGRPIVVYHYASYALPGALSAFGKLTAYESLAAFWTPFGVFLTGLAAYGLAASWWGRGAGFCAMLGFLLLPDASASGSRHYFFSYHWLQQSCPGGLYGVAVAGAATLLTVRGTQARNWRCLALGLLVGASAFGFKAQIFVMLMPLLVGWSILFHRAISPRWRMASAALIVALSAALVFVFNRPGTRERFGIDGAGAGPYLRHLETDLVGMPFSQLYHRWLEGYPGLWSLAGLAAILAVTTFGAVLILSLAVLVVAKFRHRLQDVDALPALAILIYLVAGLGPSFLPWFELQHRPFVWAYFLLTAWTWGRAYALLKERAPDAAWLRPRTLALVAIGLLAVPLTLGSGVQSPPLSWAGPCSRVRVPRGLVACAWYLRKNSGKEDVIQDSQFDESLILGGLAERRAYLSRPGMENVAMFWSSEGIRARRAELERLRRAETPEALRAVVRETGIRWYVAHPGDQFSWPESIRDKPAFASGGYRVYKLRTRERPQSRRIAGRDADRPR